jgi:hypothetical protein
MAEQVTVRFGRHKGAPLSELPDEDLEWYRDQIQQSIEDPGKARWRRSNLYHLRQVDEHLRERRHQAPATQAVAPQNRPKSTPADLEVPDYPISPTGEPLARFGRRRGVPLTQLSREDLTWYRDQVRRSVDDPEKDRWRSDNVAHLRDIDRVVRERQAAAAPRTVLAPPRSTKDKP